MRTFLALLLSLFWVGVVSAATLLPNGKQVFLDQNGQPLANGTVTFYIPNTSTPKQTWRDPGQTTLNTTPVVLDGYGSGVIYGTGTYREIVQDVNGNVIWDQLTADTSSSQESWAGTSTGTSNSQILGASQFSGTDGQLVWFRAGYSNTSALNVVVNLTTYAVYKDTPSGPILLSGGEVVTNNVVGLVYDQVLGAFHTVNPQASTTAISTLVAASTTDLGSAASHTVKVTGSSTITSFGSSASPFSPLYNVWFTSSVILTASASLGLPTSSPTVNLPANSSLVALFLGSGNWQVLSISPGDGSSDVPAGMVAPFNLAACPSGWTVMDGTAASPDMRGYFVRGLDTGGAVDPGRVLASLQQDQVQNHTHGAPGSGAFLGNSSVFGTLWSTFATSAGGNLYQSAVTGQMTSGNAGTETRPKNVALLYCVKN